MKDCALRPEALLVVVWGGEAPVPLPAPAPAPAPLPPAPAPPCPLPESAPFPGDGEVGVLPVMPPDPAGWPGDRFSEA